MQRCALDELSPKRVRNVPELFARLEALLPSLAPPRLRVEKVGAEPGREVVVYRKGLTAVRRAARRYAHPDVLEGELRRRGIHRTWRIKQGPARA